MSHNPIRQKLQQRGLTLPQPPPSVGAYRPAMRSGHQLHLSGGLSLSPEKAFLGKVGSEVTLEEAREAAVMCLLNRLAVVEAELGGFERMRRVVALSGFVNSPPDFTEQPKVIDAASELLVDLFGEAGQHSRIAVGVSALPLNAAVEISMIVEIAD